MSFLNIDQKINQNTNIEEYLNNKTRALVSPKTSPGISGFVFDIPQREQVSLSADITEKYTENNEFLNDHRVIKPVRITLTGLIGELVIKEDILNLILDTLRNQLTQVPAFLGDYTDGMNKHIQKTLSLANTSSSQIKQVVNRVNNIVEGFNGEGAFNNLQQRAFNNLEALHLSQSVVTVQTPWKYYDSMMIESIDFTQEEDTEFISNVSVTLKEIRFTIVETYKIEGVTDNRNTLQKQESSETGQIKGSRKSMLLSITNALSGDL